MDVWLEQHLNTCFMANSITTTIDIFPFSVFFSVDIRDRDPNAAKRWSDETVFSNRAYFLFDKLPGELAVQNAKDSDTGNKFSYQLLSLYSYDCVCIPQCGLQNLEIYLSIIFIMGE